MATSLSLEERLDWLQLYRSKNVGPVTFDQLLQRYESAAAALEALPTLVRRGGGKAGPALTDRHRIEQEFNSLQKLGELF